MTLEKKMDRIYTDKDDHHDEDDDDAPLPGFRFHPTDEELVRFYLRRKVEKKPISLEIIKSLDIYKHDPWDLPKATSTAGDKEWYFFCKRGRKYKNSIRPNRVTGSGFWKATGIDKPIHNSQGNLCIGLKKTLVYYRGSAGKGTKTDWMMHEFRLPAIPTTTTTTATTTTNHLNNTNRSCAKNNTTTDPQEAEIWTLCRIFKRNVSYRKYTPADWRDLSAATKCHPMDTTLSSKECSEANHLQEPNINGSEAAYNIDFGASTISYEETKPQVVMNHNINTNASNNNQLMVSSMQLQATHPYMEPFTNFSYADENEFLNANWDELRSVVQFALDPTFL